ncbi:Anaphase-promoting complex subunit 2 [Balamuthia mandrillaris]
MEQEEVAAEEEDLLWEAVSQYLAQPYERKTNTEQQIIKSKLSALAAAGYSDFILRWYWGALKQQWECKDKEPMKTFWEVMSEAGVLSPTSEEEDAQDKEKRWRFEEEALPKAVEALAETLRPSEEDVCSLLRPLCKGGEDVMLCFRRQVQMHFFLKVPVFLQLLACFFSRHFDLFTKWKRLLSRDKGEQEEEDDGEAEEDDENDDEQIEEEEMKEKLERMMEEVGWKLYTLPIANVLGLLEGTLSELLLDRMEQYIVKNAGSRDSYAQPVLRKMLRYANDVVFAWLRFVLLVDGPSGEERARIIDSWQTRHAIYTQWKTRLSFHLYETFAGLRIRGLFDIIVDFPDSEPALLDLKECLAHTDQQPFLVSSLTSAFKQRLLHAGANTSDIITTYISTIKALRLLDPSGIILEAVSSPIHLYLREREDTIRCIITNLTDQNSELYEELDQGDTNWDEFSDSEDEEDKEGSTGEPWQPETTDALLYSIPGGLQRRRKRDVISMLLEIYGSKEMFVAEYKNMLADRLLAVVDYDTDQEIRTLELLKLRFGDVALHECQIMVQDLADSKRINQYVHSSKDRSSDEQEEDEEAALLNATILSSLFWPPFRAEKVKLPPTVTNMMKSYEERYQLLKDNRQLTWHSHLGTVDLELEFPDGTTKQFSKVAPLQAAIINLFQDKEHWTSDELASALEITTEVVKRRLGFWIAQGVLQEVSKDNYKLLLAPSDGSTFLSAGGGMEEEGQSALSSVEEQDKELWEVCGQFINAMLMNSADGMPLDNIHMMLQMTCPIYDKSGEELRSYLDKQVREEKLFQQGGTYSHKPK